jgi:hypothetical protein
MRWQPCVRDLLHMHLRRSIYACINSILIWCPYASQSLSQARLRCVLFPGAASRWILGSWCNIRARPRDLEFNQCALAASNSRLCVASRCRLRSLLFVRHWWSVGVDCRSSVFRCQEHMTPFLNAILAGLLGAIPLVAFTLPNVLDEDVREARSGLHAALLAFGLCGFASLFSALCLQLINRRWPPRDPRDAPATRP